ncbi:MAG: hypothetical protein ACRBM6_24915 [Geminicoccales bacterium]
MTETLLSPSSIQIFGRVLGDLTIDTSAHADAASFLGSKLKANGAKLARIYGFSVDGQYVDVVPPAIFLVHGSGTKPTATIDLSGIAYTDDKLATDVMVWSYDKDDFTLRLDPSSGTFGEVLLSYELDDAGAFAGAQARGAQARGAQARGNGD